MNFPFTDTAPDANTAPAVALFLESEVVTGPLMTKLLKSSLSWQTLEEHGQIVAWEIVGKLNKFKSIK